MSGLTLKDMRLLASFFLATVAGLLLTAPAQAELISIRGFSSSFPLDGDEPAGGGSGSVLAFFESSGDEPVRLTLSASNLLPGEYLAAAYFRVSSDVDLSQLQVTQEEGVVPVAIESPAGGVDAGNGRLFDLVFRFTDDPSSANRFEGGQSAVFLLQQPDGLEAGSFLVFPQDGEGPPAFAAARVGNIGGQGGSSLLASTSFLIDDFVAVPEPSTFGLIGASLGALAWRRRSR